jgi:mRNA-degrading endonuclease RelE of RelBE toxin-antitoxin system
MTWDLVITKPAVVDLKSVPRADLERINETFDLMREHPYRGDVKFLRGAHGVLRRRVGAWRVFFEVVQEERLIVVLSVRRRGSNTY